MDFIEKISDEELIYVCTIITGKTIKLFFRGIQKNLIKSVRAIVQMEFLIVKQLS